jgi:hypothetical protein
MVTPPDRKSIQDDEASELDADPAANNSPSSNVETHPEQQERPQNDGECGRNSGLEVGHVHEVLVGVRNDDADDEIDDRQN